MSYLYRFLKKNLFIITLFISHAVFSQPVINSFSPTSGPVGTYVTIFGTGFNAFADSNIVYFGGVRANVIGASDTSLTVTAPAGATYRPITVTTSQLTAYSDKPFIITFGGDVAFTAGSLAAKTDFTAGATTVSITSTDLNGDGKSELIAANYGGSSISIFKNKGTPGNISFNAAQNYTTSGRVTSVTTGDLDGDGKPDIIASVELNNVSIFRNTTVGDSISFGSELILTTGNYAESVSVNDLDGDGKPDVAVTNNQSNTVTVYKNTSAAGIISFASPVTFSTGTTTQSVAVGDIDGDRKPELVVTNYFAYTVSVFRNTSTPGTISFASKTDFATGAQPSLVVIGDLDGDGKADLVTGNSQALSVSVLINTSSVGSISFASKIDYPTGQTPYGVAIGDIDGDGKPDIATGNYSTNNISLLKNTSTPGSVSFLPKTDYTTANSPYSICIADLDGDGKPELATANFGSASVSVFRNKIKESVITSFSPTIGTTGTHVTIIGTYFTNATSVTFGGITADSFAIISDTVIIAVVGHGNSGNVSVVTPNGTATKAGFTYDSTGNIALPPVITMFSPTSGRSGTPVVIRGTHFTGTTAVRFGGINARSFSITNDSLIIAIVGTGNTGSVVVIKPSGIASKTGFTFISSDTSAAPVITSIYPLSGPVGTTVTITGHRFNTSAAGNVVYFGAIRAVVISATDSTIITTVPNGATYKPVTVTTNFLTAYYERPFSVTFPGTGFNSASFAVKQDFITGTYPRCVSMSDLDGDGKTDMVVVNNVGNTISVYRNTASVGNISFTTKTDYDAGKNPMNATVGDVDGDGKQDVIIASYGNDTIIFYKNISTAGTISFAPSIKFATGINPAVVIVRDLNGDGKPEIITVNQNGNNVAVLKNTGASGSISFNTRYYLPVGNWPGGLTVADMNGDGKPDIVTANYNDNTISVLKNQSTISTISFAPKVDYATGTNPFHVCAGDLNGDGKPEIIVANAASSNISVYNNTSDSTISLSQKTDYLTASGPLFPSVDNLDGDGRPDVSVADFYASQLSVLKNTSDSGMISLNTNVDFATGFSPRYVAAGDLDGDGKPDLAVVNSNSNTVSIFRNLVNDSMLITSRLITGENSNLSNGKFTIYPNPATQFVTVKHPAINHYSQIQLVDLSGRLVKTLMVGNNATQTTVNLQGLTPGVYKLILSDGEKTFTGTLLVK